MSCQQIENRILDCQENQLPAAQRKEVETHLEGCADCRAFALRLRQLDETLSAVIKVPVLSSHFDRRLQEKIQAASAPLSNEERAERKRQMQAEFDAGVTRISRGEFALGNLVTHMAWPVLAAVAIGIVWRFTPQLTGNLRAQNLGGLDPNLLPWLAASLVFLAFGLAEAFPRQLKTLDL
jgi:anti-sigma factor RsiW